MGSARRAKKCAHRTVPKEKERKEKTSFFALGSLSLAGLFLFLDADLSFHFILLSTDQRAAFAPRVPLALVPRQSLLLCRWRTL
jgi:hypothetical protein